jgi:O-antigen/teichoic acid export membrane protein
MNSSKSLKKRSLLAALWAGGGHTLSQVLRLIGNLILTRFLMPEAFGIMSVISALLMALYLLSDIGTGVSVVQSERGTERDFLHTAWTLQVIRGFVLWLVGIGVSFGVALGQELQWFAPGTVYADPRLQWLLIAACFATVIGGFLSINVRLAERRLDLKHLFVLEIMGQMAGLTVMVLGAIFTASIWSLVAGALTQAAVRCVLSHLILQGERMAFRLERSAVAELISKGKWVLLSSLFGFLAVNGDRVLLGGMIDSATMGFYSIAIGLSSIAVAVISVIYAKVVFPSLSEVVRKDIGQLGKAYRRFQAMADLAIGGLAGFMFMMSQTVVTILYDDRYQMAGTILGILCIGTIGERFRVVEQIYLAVGRTALVAYAMGPRVCVLLLGIPLGHSIWGLHGALGAIVLSQFAHWPLAIWFRSTLGLNDFRRDLVLPLAIALGAALGWCGAWVFGKIL